MARINCHIPIKLRISGEPADAQFDELSATFVRGLAARLDFAGRTIASANPSLELASRPHLPTFTFKGQPAGEETRRKLELWVNRNIARALGGGNTSDIRPRIVRASTRGAQLHSANGSEQKVWNILRGELFASGETTGNGDVDTAQLSARRAGAIDALLSLVSRSEAQGLLREALNSPEAFAPVRLQILAALEHVPDKAEIHRDLILLASGRTGERLAEGSFADWFRQETGREAVEYLERKLKGASAELQRKAAHIVVHLLELENSAEASRLRKNLSRLRGMAERNGLRREGALGVESLQQIVQSQIVLLLDLIPLVSFEVQMTILGDPYESADVALLTNFQTLLRATLDEVYTYDLAALKELDGRLNQAIQAALHVQKQVRTIHESVQSLKQFIGANAAESDEIRGMYEIRHKYIGVFADALGSGDFAARMHEADLDFTYSDTVVASIKWERVRRIFNDARTAVIEAGKYDFSNMVVVDPNFAPFREALRKTEVKVWTEYAESYRCVAERGGPQSVVNRADCMSLTEAMKIESLVMPYSLDSAMFGQYTLALYLHNQLFSNEIGSESFRDEQAKILSDLRAELLGFFSKGDYQGYAQRSPQIQESLVGVSDAISARVRRDVAVHLLIGAVAALVTAGAGSALALAALARLATVGRVIATVRAVDALGVIALAAETGVFTATYLVGERLAFGKQITFERAGESFLTNLAFGGVFKLFGKFVTGPIAAEGGLLRRMILPHVLNAGAMTTVSGVSTAIETGHWPDDIKLFLFNSVANYAIGVGISSFVQSAARGAIQKRVEAIGRSVDADMRRLFQRYQRAVETGTLTEREFETIRQERLSINQRMRLLGEVLRGAHVISEEKARAIEDQINADDAFVRGVQFTPRPALPGGAGEQVARALPSPARIEGIERVGESAVYRYPAGRPPAALPQLLAQFEGIGYRIQKYPGGTIHVYNPRGASAFIIVPGQEVRGLLPMPKPTPLLPSGEPVIERVTKGLTKSQFDRVSEELRRVHPNIVKLVRANFPEEIAFRVLDLLYANRGRLSTRWGINSLRGLAKALDVPRGIAPSKLERLFGSDLSSERLGTLFKLFNEIADMPGARYLFDDFLTPAEVLQMVRAYQDIHSAGMKLPEKMSREAVEGLKRWVEEDARQPFLDRLVELRVDERLDALEIASGRVTVPAASDRIHAVLLKQAADIRPGINLLRGTPEDIMLAIEAYGRTHGGRFADAAVREKCKGVLARYQRNTAKLSTGGDVERNVIGDREEIEVAIMGMEAGGEIFAFGTNMEVKVNPAYYTLPNGGRILNAPPELIVQLDLGMRTVSGDIKLMEATTGGLTLPEVLQGLDPKSRATVRDVDLNALQESNASHRKWKQIIKLRALAKFSTELGEAWGHADVRPPKLVIRVSYATDSAVRALEAMGFEVEFSK
jgi:hypothetical protein